MMTEVDEATAVVVALKVPVVAPAGTVTLGGTWASVVLLLESVTCAPLEGAGPFSVTVTVEDCAPPTTVVGLNVKE
jgi:hypothetical protein